jgi:import receptor subunit TOM70
MSPPNHELVVQDCDEAVALDKNYVKAINRRGVALEHLERYEEAIRGASSIRCAHFCSSRVNTDYTAATILDKFQNEAAAQSVDRVLKKMSAKSASEIMAVCCRSIYCACRFPNSTLDS